MLEAGGYFNEADFNQLELWAYQNLYWRGGPTPTADLNVTLQAGAGLGGGTVDQLDQLPAHQARGCASSGRASTGSRASTAPSSTATSTPSSSASRSNDRCSDLNGPQQRMKEGAERLGWSFKTIMRNADADATTTRQPPAYIGFGDQSGSKQSHAQDLPARRRRRTAPR